MGRAVIRESPLTSTSKIGQMGSVFTFFDKSCFAEQSVLRSKKILGKITRVADL
jgi:hypothetical protein